MAKRDKYLKEAWDNVYLTLSDEKLATIVTMVQILAYEDDEDDDDDDNFIMGDLDTYDDDDDDEDDDDDDDDDDDEEKPNCLSGNNVCDFNPL